MNTTTTRTARIASIIEKRRPLVEKIAEVEANLKSVESALRQLDDRRNHLMPRVDYPYTSGRLKAIALSTLQNSIAAELETLGKLKARFSRNTLNIGVVGRARQGKSRLLQSLTGLTAAEIPDGNRQHCTGVRSLISHEPYVDTYGEVCFHSDTSFLDEVISPYYEKLRLGDKPITLEDFATKPLPPMASDLPGYAEPGAMYEHLCRYHDNLDKYRHLLTTTPRAISKREIREYVAQDNQSGERIFFNYLAVKFVKIVCTFPNSEVGQIALVDMPGLGDTGVGDEDRLIRTLGQEVDAVLFVRMPKSSGDYWADVDVRLYDAARAAMLDLPINLWSFMVLNLTAPESNNGDNSNNCFDLANTIEEKHIKVVDCLVANCANVEESNNILDRVIDYLADNITSLDRQFATSCQDRLIQLQKSVDTELEKARKALGQATQRDNWFPIFLRLFDEVWNDLTNGLEELLKELRTQREEVDANFKEQVDAALFACRNDTGIPTIEQIEKRNNLEKSYAIAYSKYLNEIRSHLSQHFLSLDEGLKRKVENVKSQVADVLITQGRLGGLTKARGAEFIKAIADRLPEDLIPGQPSRLKFGFQLLADFQVSYRGFVQHRIRQHLDVLTPNEPTTLQLSKSPSAEQVLTNLKTAHAQAVYKCENALEDLLAEPSQAAFAIVEEFLDCILRAADVESEWRIFLDDVRSIVWQAEFQQLGERSHLQREWLEAVEQVTEATQINYEFLN
jgi:hypothetical protein